MMLWKLRFGVLAMFALSAGVAAAQSGDEYSSLGVGANAVVEPSGGVELVLGQAVGIGGQPGAVLGQRNFGFVSADGSYHLAQRQIGARVQCERIRSIKTSILPARDPAEWAQLQNRLPS